jgi:hypothetical protein
MATQESRERRRVEWLAEKRARCAPRLALAGWLERVWIRVVIWRRVSLALRAEDPTATTLFGRW